MQYNFDMMILAVNLSSEVLDKLKIYRENFEKAYLEATEEFYKTQAAAYLQENGVQNYMKYVRTDDTCLQILLLLIILPFMIWFCYKF